MKLLGLLAVVTVVVAAESFVLTYPDGNIGARSTRANLSLGYINVGDRLLYSVQRIRNATVNTIQYEDIIYRGNTTTRVYAIRATEQGATQYANATLIGGGLGYNNATVRLQSAVGRGYNYVVQFWGL